MTFGSAPAPRHSAKIIPLPQPQPAAALPAAPTETHLLRLVSLSASWHGVPVALIPDRDLAFARRELPKAICDARSALQPGDPAKIIAALSLMAERRGLNLPDPMALEIDVEIMSEWPEDLFRKAYKAIWTGFTYRRFPEVADFHATISDELKERKQQLSRLELLERKLSLLR